MFIVLAIAGLFYLASVLFVPVCVVGGIYIVVRMVS